MRKNASTPFTLKIHLLGPFRIFVNGQAVEEHQFARRKQSVRQDIGGLWRTFKKAIAAW